MNCSSPAKAGRGPCEAWWRGRCREVLEPQRICSSLSDERRPSLGRRKPERDQPLGSVDFRDFQRAWNVI